MSDNNFEKPEAPASWDQYAQMLKDLPVQQAPAGLYSRIDARLNAPKSNMGRRPALKWALVPAVVAAGIVGIFVLSNTGNDTELNTKTMIRPVTNDSLTRGSRNSRRYARRIAPPVIQSDTTALLVDTLIPTTLSVTSEDPIVPGIRPPQNGRAHSGDVTTGGPRRDR